MKANFIGGAGANPRHKDDFYKTPASMTHALMKYLIQSGASLGKIWEPCAGDGHISSVLREYHCEVATTDIRPEALHSGEGRSFDVLNDQFEEEFDFIITNPPFNLAGDMIDIFLAYERPFALLLRPDFFNASTRHDGFMHHKPIAHLPITWRGDFSNGVDGAGMMNVSWFVWGAKPAKHTIYEPLKKPTAEDEVVKAIKAAGECKPTNSSLKYLYNTLGDYLEYKI